MRESQYSCWDLCGRQSSEMRDTSTQIKTAQKHESFFSNLTLTTENSAVSNLYSASLKEWTSIFCFSCVAENYNKRLHGRKLCHYSKKTQVCNHALFLKHYNFSKKQWKCYKALLQEAVMSTHCYKMCDMMVPDTHSAHSDLPYVPLEDT